MFRALKIKEDMKIVHEYKKLKQNTRKNTQKNIKTQKPEQARNH